MTVGFKHNRRSSNGGLVSRYQQDFDESRMDMRLIEREGGRGLGVWQLPRRMALIGSISIGFQTPKLPLNQHSSMSDVGNLLSTANYLDRVSFSLGDIRSGGFIRLQLV